MIAVYRGGPWHGRRERVDALRPAVEAFTPGEVLHVPYGRGRQGQAVEAHQRVDIPLLSVEYVLLDRRGDVGMYLCGDPSPEEMAAGWPLADLSPVRHSNIMRTAISAGVHFKVGDTVYLDGQPRVVTRVDYPELAITTVPLTADLGQGPPALAQHLEQKPPTYFSQVADTSANRP